MAAPMTEKVHVQYDASDSEADKTDDESSGQEVEEAIEDEALEDVDAGETEIQSRKSGLADVFAKILHKNVPAHQQVILAKGKTDSEIQKRKLEKEEENENKRTKVKEEDDVKSSSKVKTEPGTIKKPTAQLAKEEKAKLWENICRTKPDPLDRDKERQLQKIATRGVVQLFNAVRKQQKLVEEETQQVGGSERKKEKIMEGMTKEKFLSILKGAGNSNVKSEKNNNTTPELSKMKTETASSDSESDDGKLRNKGNKKWDILRDDYMMGAKMKDWEDSDNDDDDNESEPENPDLSDSD